MKYAAIVIGASAGGLQALTKLLSGIPKGYFVPIVIVQHRSKQERELLEMVLQQKCSIRIKQAEEKEIIKKGVVYFAPPDYHLLIENDHTISLSIDQAVKYSRPSIDVLFESASLVYRERLIGIVLTGSNDDGANGVRSIFSRKGTTIAQDPVEATYSIMPQSAIRTGAVHHILTLNRILEFLIRIEKDDYEDGR